MAGKDDFFGDGSGFGESEDTNLDDFFQPAVNEPPAPPPPEAAPPPMTEEYEPPPQVPPEPAAPQPHEAESFPEAPEPNYSVQPPPKNYSQPTGDEALFPTEQGSDKMVGEEYSDEAGGEMDVETAEAEEGEVKPGIFSRIPRVAIFITIAVVTAVAVGVLGYVGYSKFIAGKKDSASSKVARVGDAPSPIVQEKPAIEGEPSDSDTQKAPPTTRPAPTDAGKKPAAAKRPTNKKPPASAAKPPASGKGKKNAASNKRQPRNANPQNNNRQPVKNVKPYKSKSVAGLPPKKNTPGHMWTVHLERLALETTMADDAKVVSNAGLTPYREPERRSTSLTEYRIVENFRNRNDAYKAAWEADKKGLYPEVKGKQVIYALSFSRSDAQNILDKVRSWGFKGATISTVRTRRTLQSLRVGPFKTEAEALEAARKLKRKGFRNAMVKKGR